MNHKVTCYGYTIEIQRQGKFQVDKALSLDIPKPYWNRLQKGEIIELKGQTYTPDLVMGAARKGIKITYCTDTRPTKSIIDNAKESDLFICEGMYGEPGKEEKAMEYKHMTFKEAATLAKEARVHQMWLTHYSPSLNHPQEFMEQVYNIFPNAVAGKDRMSVTLEFEEEES